MSDEGLLRLLRQRGTASKGQLATALRTSRSAVTERLDALIGRGVLVSLGTAASTGGRPAEVFALNPRGGLLLAADIGGSGFRAGLADLAGDIHDDVHERLDVQNGPDVVLGAVRSRFDELLARGGHERGDVVGVGISVPGPVEFATGRPISPPIMTGWDDHDVPGAFADFDCSVLVDNDVNAMAYGEYLETYPGSPMLFMVKAGTGVGGAIVFHGELVRGAQGAAGDVGHTLVSAVDGLVADGAPRCQCGNVGCVEAYAGGWAIARDLRAEGYDVHDVEDVTALVRSGDPVAIGLTRQAGRRIGDAIATAVGLVNPDVVVLGGQFAEAETRDQLMAGVRERVYQRVLPLASRTLTIAPSALAGRAGIVGLTGLLTRTVDASIV
ncbi:MAG: ROK family transcriptional regulator [Streptosporangiales bacterium]